MALPCNPGRLQLPAPATDRSLCRGFRLHVPKIGDRTGRWPACGTAQLRQEARGLFAGEGVQNIALLERRGVSELHGCAGGGVDQALVGPPPHQPSPDGSASATPPQGGSDWSVERARAYLDRMDPNIAALFPDRFVDSELGPIPEGWEVKRIEDIAERVAMGPFGSSIKVSTFVDEGIPVISGQHLNGMLLNDNEYRFIREEHAKKLAKANVQRGDVIFTHAGSIGQVACIPQTSQFERYVISQRQFYMRCDVSQISPLFVVHFFKTPKGRHQLLANTSSTGVPSISRPVTYLRSIILCTPPNALWHRFNEIARGLQRSDRTQKNPGPSPPCAMYYCRSSFPGKCE